MALLHTLSIAAFSLTIALLIDGVIQGQSQSRLLEIAGWFVLSVLVRAASLFGIDAISQRGGARVKSQIRQRTLRRLEQFGPGYMDQVSSTEVTNLVARGIDALDVYFGRYLPQLLLTAVQMPVLLVILWLTDIPTGLAITLALPVIPVFMALIGWVTQSVQKRQWEGMQSLARGFIDVVEGLPTLKIFDRQWRQVGRIREVTHEFRRRTMAVLRVSFLSSFVLELAASLSVAIVAVSVGVRLIDGTLPLSLGLFVLVLVPEIYIPLRQVGAQFHNAADGLAAADELFRVIDAAPDHIPAPTVGATRDTGALHLKDFASLRSGSPVHNPVTMTGLPGTITVIEGPSGSGKSSLLSGILGFTASRGTISWAGRPVDPGDIRHTIAWVPQDPGLIAGSVLSNVALGAHSPDPTQARDALDRVGLSGVLLDSTLGVHGAGLSGGQAQRVALARAIYRVGANGARLVLADEVTSALDRDSEDIVWAALRDLAALGCVVLVVSHRTRVRDKADQIVRIVPHHQVQEAL